MKGTTPWLSLWESCRRRRLRGVTGGTGRTTLSLTTFDGSSQWEPSMDYFA